MINVFRVVSFCVFFRDLICRKSKVANYASVHYFSQKCHFRVFLDLFIRDSLSQAALSDESFYTQSNAPDRGNAGVSLNKEKMITDACSVRAMRGRREEKMHRTRQIFKRDCAI
jgi:hypothetical protein